MNGNNNHPLWLPKGSIRAILALGVTFGAMGYFFVIRDFPEALVTLVGVVVAFYFGTKAGSEKPEV